MNFFSSKVCAAKPRFSWSRRTSCSNLVSFIPVCKAGYYSSGSSCTLCTGNEIKSTPGDAADCSADTPCDGITSVPNDEHSTCGGSGINHDYIFHS